MKVNRKPSSDQEEKSRFGIKDVRVNLIRLNKETIRRYLEGSNDINYNLFFTIRNGNVSSVRDSGTTIPMTITITSIVPKPELQQQEKRKSLLKSVLPLLS